MKHYIIGIIIVLILPGCHSPSSSTFNDRSQEWYDQTKKEILVQSDLKEDSTASTLNNGSGWEQSYYHGHLFQGKCYGKGMLTYETHYSRDGLFELRREVCVNGSISFEGIVYRKGFYGLSTWWYCNRHLKSQGVRFMGKSIGKWKKWDENGKVSITESGRYSAIDSMPVIARQ